MKHFEVTYLININSLEKMAPKQGPGMKGNCKVLKSDLKDNTGALQDSMLIMMQEKYWTTVFFKAHILGAGTGNVIQFYNFVVKESRKSGFIN